MKLQINLSNAEQYSLEVDLNQTVAAFKSISASVIGIPALQQQIIYRGRILEDRKTFSEYGRIPQTLKSIYRLLVILLSTFTIGLKENSKIHISCLPEPPCKCNSVILLCFACCRIHSYANTHFTFFTRYTQWRYKFLPLHFRSSCFG